MKKIAYILLLTLIATTGFSQTLRDETKERRRQQMRRPPDNGVRQTTIFKLKGYTDSTRLYYSRTANCKMECMKVTEEDIRQVLKEGEASIPKAKDSTSTEIIFSIEGDTKTNQRIKVLVTPKGSALFVITVNPFGEKIECDCNKKTS